jgi:hypothetical protein
VSRSETEPAIARRESGNEKTPPDGISGGGQVRVSNALRKTTLRTIIALIILI